MLNLPKRMIQVLRCFEAAFSERIWEWAKVLLIGAILAPGERTVTAILRVMGLHNEKQFQNYHRVLNRTTWSSRALSRILLHLLVHLFVPKDAPIVVGIDETIERRRGAKIAAKGIYRDPVRSSVRSRTLCLTVSSNQKVRKDSSVWSSVKRSMRWPLRSLFP